MAEIKEGNIVRFFPSDRTKKRFEKDKKHYPAIVTEVNESSVDLTVFGPDEEVRVKRIPHASEAEEGRSHWGYAEHSN